jgi:hypothetical protein
MEEHNQGFVLRRRFTIANGTVDAVIEASTSAHIG